MRWLLIGCLAFIVLVAVLPHALSMPGIHRIVTSYLAQDVAGTLTVDRVKLRWLQPPIFEGILFSAPDGQPVLELGRCEFDRSLWTLLTDSRSFGELHLREPTLYLTLDNGRSNIAEAIRPTRLEDVPSKTIQFIESIERPVAGRLRIEDGRFVFQSAPDTSPATLQPFALTTTVHPKTPSTGATLVIEPSLVADHIELSRPLCNDLLKYVAPILADTTWVKGAFSLQIDGGEFPMERLVDAKQSGRLIIHEISAGPGPIVTELAKLIGAPQSFNLVNESHVEFVMSDQQIRHEGLRFQLGGLAVESAGRVAFDESINLIASVQFPSMQTDSTQIGRRLAGQTMHIPIKGSLKRPQVEWLTLLRDNPILDQWMQRLEDPEQRPVLEFLRELRQQRQANAANQKADDPKSIPSRPGGILDRPVLRRLLRKVMDPNTDPNRASESVPKSDDGASPSNQTSDSH